MAIEGTPAVVKAVCTELKMIDTLSHLCLGNVTGPARSLYRMNVSYPRFVDYYVLSQNPLSFPSSSLVQGNIMAPKRARGKKQGGGDQEGGAWPKAAAGAGWQEGWQQEGGWQQPAGAEGSGGWQEQV